MTLLDRDPHWLAYDGRRVGFIFRSPTKSEWWQTCFAETFPRMKQDVSAAPEWRLAPDCQAGIIAHTAPHVGPQYQLCNPDCAWAIAGGIENASFETLTVTPSLDGSRGGLWHGFITGGQIVGGI